MERPKCIYCIQKRYNQTETEKRKMKGSEIDNYRIIYEARVRNINNQSWLFLKQRQNIQTILIFSSNNY